MDFLKKHQETNNEKEPPVFHRETDGPSFSRQALSFLWETVKVVVISLAIILPIRYFVVQPFFVNGASMEPTFYDHEYLIIDEITYRFEEPQRGEVIVFRNPRNPSQFFIKRIIGLPNETVEIKDGEIFITLPSGDSFKLNEVSYLPPGTVTNGNNKVKLLNDEYYVLGDNRSSSLDSRVFGPIKRESIVGRTWIRGWPLNRVSLFERPEYNLR